jgi:hypothetical protein
VRPLSKDDRVHPLDDDQWELALASAELKEIQERTVAKTERLVHRLSQPPPAPSPSRH